MKKLVIPILILMFVLGIVIKPTANEEIVVSIQANSSDIADSKAMQSVSQEVNSYISSLVGSNTDSKTIYKIIKENTKNIQNVVNNHLKGRKLTYKAIVTTKLADIPLSDCSGYKLKQGLYKSLVIMLGNCEGSCTNFVVNKVHYNKDFVKYKSRFDKNYNN